MEIAKIYDVETKEIIGYIPATGQREKISNLCSMLSKITGSTFDWSLIKIAGSTDDFLVDFMQKKLALKEEEYHTYVLKSGIRIRVKHIQDF